jgi:hypothetical protein
MTLANINCCLGWMATALKAIAMISNCYLVNLTMATLTIEIDKEKDLPAVEAFLKQMGLEYQVEDGDDDWGDVPPEAIDGIKAGLADGEAGRVHSHEYVMAHVEEKLKRLREKNG